MKIPRFSIIMPTYNRKYCIANAIKSVLSQTYQAFELLIIDDGSTDNTKDFIYTTFDKEIKSQKIRYFSSNHSGPSGARNIGLKNAKYDWIAYLDTDNTWINNVLGVYAHEIIHNPTYDMFYGKIRLINGNTCIGESFHEFTILNANYIDMNALCHSKQLYNKFGGFDESMFGLEDYDLVLNYIRYKIPFFINIPLVNYSNIKNSDRVSMNAKTKNINLSKKYKKDYYDVTVLITSYNHEKFIVQSLQSVFDQQYNGKIQVIISDDGSSDKTHDYIKAFIRTHIKQNIEWLDLSSKENLGLKKNLSKCIPYIKYDHTAFLEGDDYWLNNKLATVMKFLNENKDCTMCFSKLLMKDHITNKETSIGNRQPSSHKKMTGADICRSKFINPICNLSTCVFKTNVLRACPLFDDLHTFRPSEISLSMFFERFGFIGYINIVLSVYGIHQNSQWTNATNTEKQKQIKADINNAISVCDSQYVDFLTTYLKQYG